MVHAPSLVGHHLQVQLSSVSRELKVGSISREAGVVAAK